jgi:hypothetical protein
MSAICPAPAWRDRQRHPDDGGVRRAGEPHLAACAEIVREIAREHDLHFTLALIHSEQDKTYVKSRLVRDAWPLGRARR